VSVAHAAARAGVPVLVTVHSMWSGAGGILRLAALAGLRRWPVAWSAVSGAAAESFGRSLGVEVSRLPNAIDVAGWQLPRHAGPPPAGEPVTLVSVMRLVRRKRPVELVRMFGQVRRLTGRDVRLVIVGDGPRRRQVERYLRRHGLGGYARLTGRLPRAEVLRELAAASIYVAPAPKESFGIAALEARCAGLPVVASGRGGVGEFVRDRVNGVLVDGHREMVAAIADLVCDDEMRHRIMRHNRTVAPTFDWTEMLARTAALYEAAAGRARVPAAPATEPRPALALEA
jgi:glycosyltransferase involved in cell wall biosynthesis